MARSHSRHAPSHRALTKWILIREFLRAHKVRSGVAIVAAVAAGLLAVAIPVSIGLYYDLVFNFSTRRSQILSFLPDAWIATVPAFLLYLLVLVVLRLILMFVERYNGLVIGEYFSQALREKMFLHQMRADMSHYDEKGTGKYLLRYSVDLKSIQDFVTLGLFRFAGDVALLLLALAAMTAMSPVVALLALVGIGATVAVVHFFNRRLYQLSERRRDRRSGLVSFVSRSLRGMLSIKMLNREAVEMKRFAKRSLKLLEVGKTFCAVQSAITSIIVALSYLVLVGILWYVFSAEGSTSADAAGEGLLVSFILLFVTILPVLRRTLHVESTWKMGSISFRKLIDVLTQHTEAPRGQGKVAIAGDIVLDDATFSYGDKTVFSKLSLRIPWEQTTLLEMEPGAGRSTILKILTKVYELESGTMHYGKLNGKKLDPWRVRRATAIVSASLPLLGATAFEAISYGRQANRKKEAAAMLERIQHGDTRGHRQMHMDYAIGELGSALSTAQKMQLIYARALLSDKPYLLIEDDLLWATETVRSNIVDILEELHGKKTILWMASRRTRPPIEFDRKKRVKVAVSRAKKRSRRA